MMHGKIARPARRSFATVKSISAETDIGDGSLAEGTLASLQRKRFY